MPFALAILHDCSSAARDRREYLLPKPTPHRTNATLAIAALFQFWTGAAPRALSRFFICIKHFALRR